MPSNPANPRIVFFVGSDNNNHASLWTTDGTAAGTQEITGVQGAAADFRPNYLAVLGSKVLFQANDAGGLTNLWTARPPGHTRSLGYRALTRRVYNGVKWKGPVLRPRHGRQL